MTIKFHIRRTGNQVVGMRAIASGLCAVAITCAVNISRGGAQDLSYLYPSHPEEVFKTPAYQEYKIEGHVVLYARSWPEWSPNQEFVVRTGVEKMPLVHVIYLPACCFDAPPVPTNDVFDERQFAKPHTKWRLTVHTPYWNWEERACSSVRMTIRYADAERNRSEEPRFQPAAGEENDAIPSLLAMPCLILKAKGWERLPPVQSSTGRNG